jgi:hypothetical protein
MPTSHLYQLNEIMELIVLTRPTAILDIGAGFGKYGLLAREYLEFWDGRQEYHNWKSQIDGIEVFKDYITPVHNFVYNEIYIGNAMDVLPSLKTQYDIILLIDVFEHFNYDDGMNLLNECNRHSKNIIISVPKDIGPTGREAYGNIFEAHRFQWQKKHFHRFDNKVFVPNQYSLICYIGDNFRNIKRFLLKSRVKKSFPWIIYPCQVMRRSANLIISLFHFRKLS